VTKAISIVVYALPTVSTLNLPAGVTGIAYSQTLVATGGKTAYAWSSTGTLPTGVTMSAAGVISGTPTTAGTFSFTATVTDANGKTASQALSIVVTAPVIVKMLDPWTNISATAPANITGTVAAGNVTVSAGTNRLLMVAVTMKIGTAAIPTINATYGGVTLAKIAQTPSAQKEIVWVGYLPEASIGTGAKALSVTYNGATGNASSIHVKWASFSNVNQTTPNKSFGSANTATTSATFGTAVSYVANGMTTVVAANGGATATGTLSTTPAFTPGTVIQNVQSSNTFTTVAHIAAGSYVATTSVGWTGVTGIMSGTVAVSLQP
jgi:hypothetical protein